ncbi:MAG: golvesin C-terminal-like domain-containing protein, partial [Planctomycetota bacterium]
DLVAGTLGGTWQVIDGRPIAMVDTLLHDNNEGKGDKFVIFRPNLPGAGRYHVYFNNLAHSQAATNVPIDIKHAGGTTTVSLNQQTSGNGWVSLGTFTFAAGSEGQVTVRTAGTNGYVLVDAVRFAPAY